MPADSRRSPAAHKHRAAAAASGAPAWRRHPLLKMAAAACLLALVLALATHSTLAVGRSRATVPRARLRAAAAAGASAVVNAAGQPLLTPTKLDFQAHELYLEAPAGTPRGLVLLLHKCGRSASDFWPRSAACPKCSGEWAGPCRWTLHCYWSAGWQTVAHSTTPHPQASPTAWR